MFILCLGNLYFLWENNTKESQKGINKVHNTRSMYLLNSSAADVGRQHHDEGDVDIFAFKQLSRYNKEQRMGRRSSK